MEAWIGGILFVCIGLYGRHQIKNRDWDETKATIGGLAYLHLFGTYFCFLYGFVILYGAIRSLM